MNPRVAAISVDLDEIPCYCGIHGLVPPDQAAANAIYERAIPRLEQLFEEENIPATFFVIGRDLASPGNPARIQRLHNAGHEIANHSQNHLYDMSRRGPETIRSEVLEAIDGIGNITGAAPVGFRAPGYTINDAMFATLSELGVEYDSSVFPCPTYYGAKTLAIGAIRARGRRSQSIVDDPRMLTAPADPYRVGTPYWRRGDGLLELPIGVTRAAFGQLPYIGTSVVLSGDRGATWLSKMTAGRPLVNLELHGIDLADVKEDGLEFLAPHQPDLKRSAQEKSSALRAAIRTLRDSGYEFVTLADAASRFA